MIQRRTYVLAPALLLVVGCSTGRGPAQPPQNTSGIYQSADEAARAALVSLRSLVDQSNYAEFGFQSKTEALSVTLDKPEKVYVMPTANLATVKSTTDIRPLLKDVQRAVYPVTIGGQPRTLITVQQTGNGWRLAGYGPPALGKNLVDARSAQQKETEGGQPSQSFELRIPTLQQDYLATTKGAGANQAIYLTPLVAPTPSATAAPPRGPGVQYDAVLAGMRKANKYATDVYSKSSGSTEYVLDWGKLQTHQKTAAEVLSGLAPAAKALKHPKGPTE